MRAKVVVVAVAAAVSAVCAAEGDARFPFVVSYGGADNASSVAHLLDTPAGKHGFVRVVGHEFVTDAGPIRFNGTNLTGPANFPEHDVADRLAARASDVLGACGGWFARERDCAGSGRRWKPRPHPPFARVSHALV